MRRPGGYARVSGPDGVEECDSFTCRHCSAVRFVKPKEKPEDIGGLCKLCMGLICGGCVRRGGCDHLEEKLERVERTQDFRRWFRECS